mmetsp:Transcript_47861/g.147636  ORF Transcript_47861/g.147636 Transcript_47861/m.147636 type:complete len:243 (-) Transcript_47861:32-760(-)
MTSVRLLSARWRLARQARCASRHPHVALACGWQPQAARACVPRCAMYHTPQKHVALLAPIRFAPTRIESLMKPQAIRFPAGEVAARADRGDVDLEGQFHVRSPFDVVHAKCLRFWSDGGPWESSLEDAALQFQVRRVGFVPVLVAEGLPTKATSRLWQRAFGAVGARFHDASKPFLLVSRRDRPARRDNDGKFCRRRIRSDAAVVVPWSASAAPKTMPQAAAKTASPIAPTAIRPPLGPVIA